jgi:hypothetical protein
MTTVLMRTGTRPAASDAGEAVRKHATLSGAREGFRVEGIETDVDTVESGLAQRPRERRQALAVGGQREVGHAKGRECRHQVHDVATAKRLAAGEADLGDAGRGLGHADKACNIIGTQAITGARTLLLVRTTVHAAERAAIGDRDAQDEGSRHGRHGHTRQGRKSTSAP